MRIDECFDGFVYGLSFMEQFTDALSPEELSSFKKIIKDFGKMDIRVQEENEEVLDIEFELNRAEFQKRLLSLLEEEEVT